MDCGSDDCLVCLPEYQRGKVHRFAYGIQPEPQTVMSIAGLSVETARECRRYLTDRFRQPHLTIATEIDGRITLTMIAAAELQKSYWPVIERYPDAAIAVELRQVEPSEIATLITTQHKIDGVLNPVTFSRWIAECPTEPDYQYSDPVPIDRLPGSGAMVEIPHRAKDCDSVRTVYPDDKSLSPESRAYNRERRNARWASYGWKARQSTMSN